ncbi:MAG: hypothetical protein FWC69_01490 [Defluviitaleaceae bacterium]|nr:hypothetical protein [Defluviitaleaceae bacterium]
MKVIKGLLGAAGFATGAVFLGLFIHKMHKAGHKEIAKLPYKVIEEASKIAFDKSKMIEADKEVSKAVVSIVSEASQIATDLIYEHEAKRAQDEQGFVMDYIEAHKS